MNNNENTIASEAKPQVAAAAEPRRRPARRRRARGPGRSPAGHQAAADAAAQNALKAERERVARIQEICNGEYPEIEKEAVKAGWTPEVVTRKVLDTIRAERPSASVNVVVRTEPEGQETRKNLEAALCLRCGLSPDSLEELRRQVGRSQYTRHGDAPEAAGPRMRAHGRHPARGRSFDNDTINGILQRRAAS